MLFLGLQSLIMQVTLLNSRLVFLISFPKLTAPCLVPATHTYVTLMYGVWEEHVSSNIGSFKLNRQIRLKWHKTKICSWLDWQRFPVCPPLKHLLNLIVIYQVALARKLLWETCYLRVKLSLDRLSGTWWRLHTVLLNAKYQAGKLQTPIHFYSVWFDPTKNQIAMDSLVADALSIRPILND